MNENMKLWDSVCVTDPKVTKKVNVGRSFIAICAQSQIRRATELWGPMGDKWGVRDESYNIHGEPEKSEYCVYLGTLYYPDGEILIHSDIEIQFSSGKRKGLYNEDFSKKMATDALTKGLSLLGFNADIFEGKFDNKYVAELKAPKKSGSKSDKGKPTDPVRQELIDEIVSIFSDKVFNDEDRQRAKKEIDATKKNKSLSESIESLKALKATYQSEQNKRIEGFTDDIPEEASEKKPEGELFPDEEKAATKEAANAKGLDYGVMY